VPTTRKIDARAAMVVAASLEIIQRKVRNRAAATRGPLQDHAPCQCYLYAIHCTRHKLSLLARGLRGVALTDEEEQHWNKWWHASDSPPFDLKRQVFLLLCKSLTLSLTQDT
jgi:hypothetical protein